MAPAGFGEPLKRAKKVNNKALETTSNPSEEESSTNTASDAKSLSASKTTFPQAILRITEHDSLVDRLEKQGLDADKLQQVLTATESLLWKAQDFLMELGRACNLSHWLLNEETQVQPVVKAFFVVLTRNVLGLCKIAVWIPTKTACAVINCMQVSSIPDLTIAYTIEDFSVKGQVNYSRTLFNLEAKLTKRKTEWAAENQVFWQAAGVLDELEDDLIALLHSDKFKYHFVATNMQYFRFMSTKQGPAFEHEDEECKWEVSASKLIADTKQIAGELVEMLLSLAKTVNIIKERALLQQDIGTLELGSANEQDYRSTREDGGSHPSRLQSEASGSRKSNQEKGTRGKTQGPHDQTFCQSTASTMARSHVGANTASPPSAMSWKSLEGCNLQLLLGQSRVCANVRRFLDSFDKTTICKFNLYACM